ncbi:MAG: proton-conducting transporter membrane subunit [Myxococcota bacterium]|jgi:multicomponent Na+:H+ antiporter subunit D|nr:proton-conducting transporter membrane subunit [Myxococcota bacterium]
MKLLMLAPILLPLLSAMLTALSWRRRRLQLGLSLAGAVLFLLSALGLLFEVLAGGSLHMSMGNWAAPFGIEFVIDPLAAGMILVTAVMGLSALLFQLCDADSAPHDPVLYPLVHAMLAAVSGAFSTADLFNLYVWFELMLVSSLGLLVYRGGAKNLEAALKYFVLNALGTLFLLIAIAYLYSMTGQLNFAGLSAVASASGQQNWLPFLVLLMLAFLVKSGAFPLFAWLPASYHTLPAPLLALFAGLLTKVGVYALLRVFAGVFPESPTLLYDALAWVAAATMLVGVLGAAYHWDLRRILAFHIVSQIGYMLLGIALHTQAGHSATIFYIIHHIVVKANLFLVAALIFRRGGSYDLRRLGGLYARRPGLALLFAIPALSLVGIPPLSGFWAKFLVLREAFGQGELVFALIALLVGLLTLYSMAKIWLEAFWKQHPSAEPVQGPSLGLGYAVSAALALLTLFFGILPEYLLSFADTASALMGAR